MRNGLGLAALVCLGSGAAGAAFNPRVDRTYRYDMTETRTVDGVARHFHATRSVAFRKVADGYEATITLEAIDDDAEPAVNAMFEAATGALLHRPLRYRIDAAGRVTGVEDADALIALIADAIERIAARTLGKAARTADSRALAAPLRGASPEHKAAMLLSILRPILCADMAERPAGSRAVTLPARPPLPADGTLSGTERVTRDGDRVTLDLSAAGALATAIPPGTPGAAFALRPGAAPAMTVHALRTIDAATGLLRDARETSDTMVPGDGAPRHAFVETVMRLRIDAP